MTRGTRKALTTVLGLGFGALCLWLALRTTDWRAAVRLFRDADPAAILAAFALFGLSMAMRALRWRAILAYKAPVSAGESLLATLTGYAVNAALPARLGELFRAHFLARRTGLSGSSVLASIVLERLLDLATVVAVLAVGLALTGGGHADSRSLLVAAAIIVVAGAAVLLLMAVVLSRHGAQERLAQRIARLPGGAMIAARLSRMLADFAELLQVVRTGHFGRAALLTVPIWLLEIGALWSACLAIGIHLGAAGTLTLLAGATLSTSLPTAPGYVGSYQLAFVLILRPFGIAATAAVAAATVIQVYLIGGMTLVGFAAWAAASMFPPQRRQPYR